MSENVTVIEMVPETKKSKKGFGWKIAGAIVGGLAIIGGGVLAYNKSKNNVSEEDGDDRAYPWGTGDDPEMDALVASEIEETEE